MFGKDDDSQDQPATQDSVQPSFGQTITMPAPTTDNSAATDEVATSPTVPADDNNENVTTEDNVADDASKAAAASGNDDLLKIKQSALQNLAPLVGQLDQTPEEKFKTTMMMIQAGDDATLIQTAYDTANQITDEKIRAQALLDIVNEINYFTQQHNS
ncbi:MAG TPA: hypothetical protein VLF39_04045 [Candidatus Saccharimonadales bacterium]|nr:hypothetical protein [Candidatus Saccharimonadales bacterium]